VRVQTEELEQAMDGALGDSGLFGYGAHAPMCCSLGLASECFADQLGHGLILDRARPAGPRLVVEPFDPLGDEAIAPLADGLRHDTQSLGNGGVAGLTLAGQHDLGPQRQPRRHRARSRHRQKMGALVAGHCEHRLRPAGSHRVSPSIRIPESDAIIMLQTYGTED
jgi:hypothetical protein